MPSTDSRGATCSVRTKVTPAMERAMASVIESGRFPWTCQADMMRTAIARLLNDCAAVDGASATIMSVVNLQRETQTIATIESEIDDLLDTQSAQCRLLVQDGEHWEAKRIASVLKSRLDSLPNSAHKRRALKKFNTIFQELMRVDSAPADLPIAVNGTYHNRNEHAAVHQRILTRLTFTD